MTNTSEQDEPVIYKVPSALLVPVLGGAGYALAHAHEAEYLAFFGVPEDLVRVTIGTAIVATGSLLSVLAPALYLTYFFSGGLRDQDGKFTGRPEVLVALLLFMLFVFDQLVQPSWKIRVGYMVGVAVLVPLISATASVLRERAKSRANAPSQPLNPASWLLPLIGPDVLVVVALIAASYQMAGLIGMVQARKQTQFFTLDDPSGFVALRFYDDTVIAASLDRTNRTVGPVIRLPSPEKIVARRETLGPLKALR